MNKIEQLREDVQATIEKAMSNEVSQLTTDKASEVDAGGGKIAIRRVYDFINKVGKRTQLTTFDPEVIRITETIAAAILHREKSSFIICRELHKMKESGKLKAMGFKNVGEYGKAMFDLAPLTCNQYARIGEIFIDDEYNIVGDMPKMKVSHYIEMLSFIEKNGGSMDELRQMFIDGKLSDGMSTKDIRLALNAAKEKGKAIETTFADSADSADSTDSTDSADSTDSEDSTDSTDSSDSADSVKFDKSAELQKGLDAIQVLFRVSENLKNHGITVSFNEALDAVMDGLKSLF